MAVKKLSRGNPYSAPTEPGIIKSQSRVARYLLRAVALLLFLASFPSAWLGIELANQEYLHIVPTRRAVYDIEFNGVPVTADSIIRNSLLTVGAMWALSIFLLWLSRRRKSTN